MEKNEIGCWMIACVVLIVVVAIITGILVSSLPGHARNAGGMSTTMFVETAFNWIARLVGTTTTVVGIMLLLSTGLKGASWQCMVKHVVLILIGLLVTHYSWAITLGIVGALALLAVADIVKKNACAEDSQETPAA